MAAYFSAFDSYFDYEKNAHSPKLDVNMAQIATFKTLFVCHFSIAEKMVSIRIHIQSKWSSIWMLTFQTGFPIIAFVLFCVFFSFCFFSLLSHQTHWNGNKSEFSIAEQRAYQAEKFLAQFPNPELTLFRFHCRSHNNSNAPA